MPRRRRLDLRNPWIATLAVVVLAGLGAVLIAPAEEPVPGELPGGDAPSTLALAPDGEPGERLVVRGRVFAPDGETPVAGAVLYVYQTGADGRYAPRGEEVPRLRGWVRTDAEGRYEYATIRPGSYPGRRTPAHVHAVLWGPGYAPQWGGDVLFDDDPLVSEKERRQSREAGRFAHVCSPGRTDEGELLCTRSYRLTREADSDDVYREIGHAFVPES